MPDTVTRAEHLQWCKDRAMQYVKKGDYQQAFASMGSDLNKHPETANHSAMKLGLMLLMGEQLNSMNKMSNFIEGFN